VPRAARHFLEGDIVKNRVAVIGAGNVGATTALYVAERGLARSD